jgi:hypothetical protein
MSWYCVEKLTISVAGAEEDTDSDGHGQARGQTPHQEENHGGEETADDCDFPAKGV